MSPKWEPTTVTSAPAAAVAGYIPVMVGAVIEKPVLVFDWTPLTTTQNWPPEVAFTGICTRITVSVQFPSSTGREMLFPAPLTLP